MPCRAVTALPGGRIGIAPHSLRAVDPASLRVVLDACPSGPVHIHAAEQVKEVEDSVAWSGKRPVEWLLDATEIGPRWCFIHATHMTEAETRALAATGAVAGLCPITEASLGDGIFNAVDFTRSGGRFGVGTDSNIEITASGELKQLEYSQRLRHRARNVLPQRQGESTGLTLYRAAVAGAAQALDRGKGGIAVDESADFVVLDRNHPDLAFVAGDRWLDAHVFSAGRAVVDQVYVRGERMVEAGRHRARGAIAARYASTMRRIAEMA